MKCIDNEILIHIARSLASSGAFDDLGLNWVTVLSNVSAAATEALVLDLRPSTGYQFRVAAVNNVGEGSPSSPSNTLVLPQEGKRVVALCGFRFKGYNRLV